MPHLRWILALPALVAVLVFLNTLGNGLTYDDKGTLELAEKVVSGRSEEFGRALTYATHLLDSALWRGWLPGRRLTNLALYGLAAWLVTLAARRLSGSERVALISGLLFAVHPVHVEAVASIAFRKDVLAMIFALLTVLLWTAPPTWATSVAAVVCFLLGLVSKEVALIGLLAFLFLLDWLAPQWRPGETHPGSGSIEVARPGDAARGAGRKERERESKHRREGGRGERRRGDERHGKKRPHLVPGGARGAVLRLLPLLVLAAIAIVYLNRTLHTPEGDGSIWARFSPDSIVKITEGKLRSYGQVLGTSARSFLDVIRLLVFPLRLSADYDTPIQRGLGAPGALLGLLALAAYVALALVAFRRGRTLVFLALAWTLLLYAPASNLVPLTHFFVADRYLMVPSFGICLLAALAFDAWLAASPGRRRLLPLAALGSLLLAGAVRTVLRNRDWRSEETLWAAALRAGSGSYRVHYNMGNACMLQGRKDEARSHFEAALRMYPAAPWARRNLVEILFEQQKFVEAEANLRLLLQYDPQDLQGRYSLARVLGKLNRHAEALAECQTVLRSEPQHVGAQVFAASSLEHLGQRGPALQAYRHALETIKTRTLQGEKTEISASSVEARIRSLEQASP